MAIIHQAITGREDTANSSSCTQSLIDFYNAFNNQNHQKMQDNWLSSDNASMANPLGGIKHGWFEIEAVYQKIFNGPAKVYVEFYDYSIQSSDSLFFAQGHERGTLTIGQEKIELSIRTTRIYQRHNQQWKQIHHHGSMDNPELLEKYQTLLLNTHSGE